MVRDFIDLVTLDDYGSIIYLTSLFQEPKNRGKNNTDKEFGLEQIHFRYALQKDFKFPNKWIKKEREIKNFFGNKINPLYNDQTIVKNSIKPGNTLSMILKKLVFDYKILEREKKGSSFRYSISKEYRGKTIAKTVKHEIDLFTGNEIIHNIFTPEVMKEKFPELPYDTFVNLVTFGISEEFFDSLDKKDQETLVDIVIEIYQNVALLSNFKHHKTGRKEPLAIFVNSKVADEKLQKQIKEILKKK
jgi:hypothetical protein